MTMTTRILDESPSLGGLYAKAALPAVAGVRRLPGVARLPGVGRLTGRDANVTDEAPRLPDLELRLTGIGFDAGHLARYADVCGFDSRVGVPATYPHVLAFPLQLALMTEPAFPFDVLGLVHLRNRIEQRRPFGLGDTVDLLVRAEDLRPHPRGSILTLVSEALVGGDVVWRDESVVLKRQAVGDEAGRGTTDAPDLPTVAPQGPIRWRLGGNLGRRYAAVSGDRNPIHLYDLSARAFGFKRHIAHGMWTKAASLAALGHRVPASFAIEVEFRKPVFLPSTVHFGARDVTGGIDFGVTSGEDRTHLVGRLTPA